MTHNQYISLFTNIATAHNLVKSFGTGPIHEYLDTNTDTSKGINLWLEVDNSKISGSVITDRFTLYCMDYVNKDVSNRDEVLSDTKRTLEDVIALLHNQLYVDDFELEKSTDLNVFYDEKFANEACGWYCVISLKNDFVYDSCQIPLNGIPITAISYTVDVSSGFTLAVTATRTLTINGVTYDLSADRTWTIATGGNETLAQTLALGNTTGANDIIHTNTTASTVPYLDVNKKLVSSAVTPTQLSYLDATSSIQTQLNAKVDTFTRKMIMPEKSLLASTTYYWSDFYVGTASSPRTTVNQCLISEPYNCTLVGASITVTSNNGGVSNQATAVYIRYNGSDTTLSSAVVWSSNSVTPVTYNVTGLNLAITASTSYEIKAITGAWTTAPTNAAISVILYFTKP